MLSHAQSSKRRRSSEVDISPRSVPRLTSSGSPSDHGNSVPGSSPGPNSVSTRRSAAASQGRGWSMTQESEPAFLQSQTRASSSFGASVVGSIERRPIDASADPDAQDEIVMAVTVGERGSVGCAYYSAREEKLFFMEDVRCGGPDTVDQLKLFIEPTIVLVSTKSDDEVMKCLDPGSRSQSPAEIGRIRDHTYLPYLLESRPSAEFGYESARNKLVNLRLGQPDGPRVTFVVPGDVNASEEPLADGDTGFVGRHGQLLRLSGWINMDSRITVGCAGAVLAYLQRRRTTAYLPGDQDAAAVFRISVVEMFSLRGTLFINADTLASLQITSTELHPSAQNLGPASKHWSSGSSKEGLSVYGLFHPHARTAQGRSMLRQYFLRPSLNVDVINERLNTIEAILRPDNAGLIDQLVDSLGKVKNMRLVTTNLRKGLGSGIHRNRGVSTHVWPSTRDFVFYALRITDIISEMGGISRLAIGAKVLERFDRRALAMIGRRICDVVDFDATREQHRTVVRPGIDDELDSTKRTYDGIEHLLSQVADHVAARVPAGLDSHVNVIFFPQIGFLICIRLVEGTNDGVYGGSDADPWVKLFATEGNAYYKNSEMKEMDQHFGDVYGRICDREIEIAQQLGEQVLEQDELLHEISDICGELDALVALARGAQQHAFARPRLTQQNIIDIKGGRHPLQELTVPNFVPNDTFIVGGEDRGDIPGDQGPSVVLLTGPNFSGKSVYLKQVAIIVYMAHVGSYVPAEAAKIGLTDKILTRISTRESVSRMQSAFMIDLQQTCVALSLATRRSLIVMDELGKGTESNDGAGLCAGVFEHLLRRGAACPKVLGATHFHEIFEAGFLAPRDSLSLAHMEVQMDSEASNAEDQVTYLYNYRPGRSVASFGTCCAAMNGVADPVVKRAEELVMLAVRGEDLVESCAALPAAELEELEDAEAIARDFLATDIEGEPRKILDDLITLVSVAESATEVS